MPTYVYTRTDSDERNRNVKITVWRIKRNEPLRLGEAHRNTAGWKGEKAVANSIIAEYEGFNFDGYNLERQDVELYRLNL